MPLPRGSDPEKAIIGYMECLKGLPIEAIAHGIRRFLRGECEGISTKFCPHPPELATICRGQIPDRPRMPTGRLYSYSAPHSLVIEARCTKEWAWGLIRRGVHPVGSIWCPGPVDDKPEIGDLYGPDPEWRKPRPIEPFKAA